MTGKAHPAGATGGLLSSPSTFARIVVGVDGTEEGFEACRQASRLADPGATVEAAAVVELAPGLLESLEQAATASLATATGILGDRAQERRLYGFVVHELLAEAERIDATLLAVGTHGHPRIEEIVLGGIGGELLHRARCSVLVARAAPVEGAWPRSLVVGVDGSDEAEWAFAVATALARRFHCTVRAVVARGGKRVDRGAVAHGHPRVEVSPAAPVRALVEASAGADLLVVGSRGLHGVRALGSVSERVAHQAGCSVLVVR